MQRKPWREFEEAVAAFIQGLLPSTQVDHDVQIHDLDTGRPRQRDVWFELKVGGHFLVKFLVSCKRHTRKMNISHVDAFWGELRSSGAQKGVIYSYSGFTGQALEKAEKLGISCCCLYTGRPADMPELLLFQSYCCTPTIAIGLKRMAGCPDGELTYGELFGMTLPSEERQVTVLDAVVTCYKEAESRAVAEFRAAPRKFAFPEDWVSAFGLGDAAAEDPMLKIVVRGHWKIHRAKLKGHLINGSYEFVCGDFKGSQCTPLVDMRGPVPGPGWELLPERPATLEQNRIVLVLQGGDARAALLEHWASQTIP